MSVSVILDSNIRLNPRDFPAEAIIDIKDLLRITNPAKNRAEREMLWGSKELPESIELWKEPTSRELVLPRGHWDTISQIAHNHELDLNWVNNTIKDDFKEYHKCPDFPLRDYQDKAVEELFSYQGGIYSAPTGAGKSRVMLDLIRSCDQKTILICEKSDIQNQWIKYADELGFISVGKIGSGIWDDEKDLTIALRQSLSNKDLDQSWYKQFGTVIYDEIHHGSAPTVFDLIQKFPAYYRYGCSATPDSDPDLFPIISAVIGPVVHFTPVKEIGDHLVIPSVRVVNTDFEFPYRPTYRLGNKVIRNNYNSMMSELERDQSRNSIIADMAMKDSKNGHQCLVISKRKTHIREIFKSLQNNYQNYEGIFTLTGDNSDQYSVIAENIDQRETGSITFSTLASEGTDISRWDRLFLVYPGRKILGFEQAIGRIMRPHPKKNDAIVYDFRDHNVSLLNSQYRFRAQNIYNKKNYKVEVISD